MATFEKIDCNLIKATSRSVHYEIVIGKERKKIRFKKVHTGYVSIGKVVYVSISDVDTYERTVPNRVRKAYLYLYENKFINPPRLCEHYSVLKKHALILSWVKSKQGRYLQHTEAKDSILPKPDFNILEVVLRLQK